MKQFYPLLVLSVIIVSVFIAPTTSSAFWLRYHESVTKNGLPFLKQGIVSHIVEADKYQDSFAIDVGPIDLGGPGAYEKIHFDACAFKEASQHIQSDYNTLKKKTTGGSDNPIKAAWAFGDLLHTVQDFYSHSNWVELDQSKIVDSGVGPWKTIDSWQVLPGTKVPLGDVVVIELPSPFSPKDIQKMAGWSVDKLALGSIPIPKVKDPQGNIHNGLFSHGREGYKLGDHCPSATQAWNHNQLNKDGDTPRKYAGQIYQTMHKRALDLATSQTAQEWCRYLNLLKSDPAKGFPAVSIPMGLWVDKNGSPHPTGTQCSQTELGTKSVIVTISNIKVINDLDDDNNPGDLNLDFVLYKGDLGRSVRNEVGFVEVQSGANWPSQKLPSSLTMCLKPSDTLVATVQGWDDEANTLKGELNPAIYDTTYNVDGGYSLKVPADTTLKGVTFAVPGPTFGQGVHRLTSENIEVTFQISMMPYCIPEGVTSQSTDTDKDGVVDSRDNCRSIPNPDQKDTDNDRIGDACDLDLKDTDSDGVVDSRDNCDFIPNPDQKNTNGDEFGDACQGGDQDNDGVVDSIDNCRWVANPDQKDEDKNGTGDACKDVIL